MPGSIASLITFDKFACKQNTDIWLDGILNRLKKFHTKFLKQEDLELLFFKFNTIKENLDDEDMRAFYLKFIHYIKMIEYNKKKILVSPDFFPKDVCSACQAFKITQTEFDTIKFYQKIF